MQIYIRWGYIMLLKAKSWKAEATSQNFNLSTATWSEEAWNGGIILYG